MNHVKEESLDNHQSQRAIDLETALELFAESGEFKGLSEQELHRFASIFASGCESARLERQQRDLEDLDTAMVVAVGGDYLQGTLCDHVRACTALIADEQSHHNPDNAVIAVLCNSVRLAREHVQLARSRIQAASRSAEQEREDAIAFAEHALKVGIDLTFPARLRRGEHVGAAERARTEGASS